MTRLDIYCLQGYKKYLNFLINSPFTSPLEKLPMKVNIHEINEGEYSVPLLFKVRKLFHGDATLGFCFQMENKIITYCSDTGICENDELLAKNADVLIHECSYIRQNPNSSWGHTTPDEAANLAKKAGVKQLILTHFAPDKYPTLTLRDQAEITAKKIFPNSTSARDGMMIEI